LFVRTTLAVVAAALIATAGTALAQTQPAPPAAGAPAVPGARHQGMKHLLSTLNLSADQQAKIDAISAKYRQQNQNVTDPAQRQANRLAQRQEIMAVLTPAQQTKLKSAIDAMHKKHGENASGAPPAQR